MQPVSYTHLDVYKRQEQKIIERLVRAGSVITKPASTHMPTSSEDGSVWVLENAAEKQLIDVYQFSGDLQYEMAYLSQDVYKRQEKTRKHCAGI